MGGRCRPNKTIGLFISDSRSISTNDSINLQQLASLHYQVTLSPRDVTNAHGFLCHCQFKLSRDELEGEYKWNYGLTGPLDAQGNLDYLLTKSGPIGSGSQRFGRILVLPFRGAVFFVLPMRPEDCPWSTKCDSDNEVLVLKPRADVSLDIMPHGDVIGWGDGPRCCTSWK